MMPENNRTILSVSELNAEVNQLLTQGFPLLWVEGEISNLARPASGHLYFSLKDSKAQIRCAMFRSAASRLSIRPENGAKVIARGRISLYEPRGDYQFIADSMQDAGEGELQRQFEELKRKLEAEGLFAAELKKSLPPYPARIGIVTSPSGAAVRDLLHEELRHRQSVLRGLARALDFVMRKRIVSAQEAAELGLVNEVVPADELLPRAFELAAELAEGPQVAMRLLKRSMYNAAELTFAQACEDIAARTAIVDHHPDAREGVLAWREKRAPRFNQKPE